MTLAQLWDYFQYLKSYKDKTKSLQRVLGTSVLAYWKKESEFTEKLNTFVNKKPGKVVSVKLSEILGISQESKVEDSFILYQEHEAGLYIDFFQEFSETHRQSKDRFLKQKKDHKKLNLGLQPQVKYCW